MFVKILYKMRMNQQSDNYNIPELYPKPLQVVNPAKFLGVHVLTEQLSMKLVNSVLSESS